MAFLSVRPTINPSFPLWIPFPLLNSVLYFVGFSSHLFGVSLSPSCCSWHIVFFHRWWLICETALSATHIWSAFTATSPPNFLAGCGKAKAQIRSLWKTHPTHRVSRYPLARRLSWNNTQTHWLTNSHPFHGRYGLHLVSDPSHVACCHSVKCQLMLLIFPDWFLKPSDYSIRIYIT